jgi:hypothetical protein
MSNKDLFKQAIAEAKTIREAAITNAKEALEESLTPHLKEMLAQKLQEMEEDDNMEEIVNEEDMINDPQGETAHGNVAEAEEEEAEEAEGEEAEGEEAEGEEAEEEELDLENMSVEEFKDLVRDIVAQEIGQEGSEEEMPGEEAPEGAEDMVGMDSEEEIDINELLAELAEMEEKEVPVEEGAEGFDKWLDGVSAQMEKFGKNNPAIQAIERAIAAAQDKAKKAGITGHGMTKGHRISEKSDELKEALATVAELRTQLQEVNLLNAKLLYVNKVFKANNLTESQKVNVVAAFDKAETVKEVKLVFETVSKNVVTKPVTIKEHKSFASKAAGTAATAGKKEIISEVSEQVARWQKLAGIIK